MKLEEGMYVRTEYGYIDKILLVEYAEEKRREYPNHPSKNHWRDKILLFKEGYWRTNQNIKKASHNLIDLIEEGDFVKVRIDGIFINCFMVDLFEDENENQELGIGCYEDGLLNSISEYRPLKTLEILEVVTKEQFKSISYEVSK